MKKNNVRIRMPSLNRIIGKISRCDVIIKDGEKQFIGLCYDPSCLRVPFVMCKGSWSFNYSLLKIAELIGIPCVENKLMTRTFFDTLYEGKPIPTSHFHAVSEIYAKLEKFKNREEESDFMNELIDDVLFQIKNIEKEVYEKVDKSFKKLEIEAKAPEGDIVEIFEKNFRMLTKSYDLDYKIVHYAATKTDEIYIESYFEKYDLDFWQMVFISEEEQKIYIATRTLFKCFDFSEFNIAVTFLKELISACNNELKETVQMYCEELDINPRLFDIAVNSMKTMLEVNYNQNGIEYGFTYDKAIFALYLKKKKDKKMYEVLITYKEFSRNPDLFKKFITSPKTTKQWNFYSKRVRYDEKCFDEKFQKENQPMRR